MKTTLTFLNTSRIISTIEANLLPTKSVSLNLSTLGLELKTYLIHYSDYCENAPFTIASCNDYQLLYFDNEKQLIDISTPNVDTLTIKNGCKWLVIIPRQYALAPKEVRFITTFSLNYSETDKAEIQNYIATTYPLARFAGSGIFITSFQRLKGEYDLQIPIPWQQSKSICTKTGKYTNELNPEEWNTFFKALSAQLKTHYPETYYTMFPEPLNLE